MKIDFLKLSTWIFILLFCLSFWIFTFFKLFSYLNLF